MYWSMRSTLTICFSVSVKYVTTPLRSPVIERTYEIASPTKPTCHSSQFWHWEVQSLKERTRLPVPPNLHVTAASSNIEKSSHWKNVQDCQSHQTYMSQQPVLTLRSPVIERTYEIASPTKPTCHSSQFWHWEVTHSSPVNNCEYSITVMHIININTPHKIKHWIYILN